MKNDDLMIFEKEQLSSGITLIAGVDEVGRGPLAGPVVVCAIIMDLSKPRIDGIADSKKLTAKKREFLYDKILESSISFSISSCDHCMIDEINILKATKKAMKESILNLSTKPEVVLIDAVKLDIDIPSVSIIHGDDLSYSIACASIIAKVYRDRLMEKLDTQFPVYEFAKHKGYGTKTHINAIQKYGICEIHRKTFVKNFLKKVE